MGILAGLVVQPASAAAIGEGPVLTQAQLDQGGLTPAQIDRSSFTRAQAEQMLAARAMTFGTLMPNDGSAPITMTVGML